MTGPKQPRRTLRTDARRLVEACAGVNSRLAARRITQYFDRELAASGLSLAQLGLMAQIASASDDTLGALAHRSGLEQSTLSRNLRTLEGGWIDRDRRCGKRSASASGLADRDGGSAPRGCDPHLAEGPGKAGASPSARPRAAPCRCGRGPGRGLGSTRFGLQAFRFWRSFSQYSSRFLISRSKPRSTGSYSVRRGSSSGKWLWPENASGALWSYS